MRWDDSFIYVNSFHCALHVKILYNEGLFFLHLCKLISTIFLVRKMFIENTGVSDFKGGYCFRAKVCLVKDMVFPLVMYGCESWTVKKAECQKIDAFKLWCWRRLLRVPWNARRSVLGVQRKDWCLSGNSNTLATLCKELTHWKRPWCWEGLGAAGEGDDRGWDGWMASSTRWTTVWVNSGSWWWTGRLGVLRFMGSQRVGHDWATEVNWTECFRERKL